jgi:hypothetical protein
MTMGRAGTAKGSVMRPVPSIQYCEIFNEGSHRLIASRTFEDRDRRNDSGAHIAGGVVTRKRMNFNLHNSTDSICRFLNAGIAGTYVRPHSIRSTSGN